MDQYSSYLGEGLEVMNNENIKNLKDFILALINLRARGIQHISFTIAKQSENTSNKTKCTQDYHGRKVQGLIMYYHNTKILTRQTSPTKNLRRVCSIYLFPSKHPHICTSITKMMFMEWDILLRWASSYA